MKVLGSIIANRRTMKQRASFLKKMPGKIDSPMYKYLQGLAPMWDKPANQCQFLVVDIETTGVSPENNSILSIGHVPIIEQRIQMEQARHNLFKTSVKVGQSAAIHGIHDEHISISGENPEDIMQTFLEALSGRILVAHFAKLDLAFINKICQNLYGVPLLVPTLDTLEIESRHWQLRRPDAIPSLRLDLCRQRYGLPNYSAHNAVIDAIATAELWLAQASHMQANGELKLHYFA